GTLVPVFVLNNMPFEKPFASICSPVEVTIPPARELNGYTANDAFSFSIHKYNAGCSFENFVSTNKIKSKSYYALPAPLWNYDLAPDWQTCSDYYCSCDAALSALESFETEFSSSLDRFYSSPDLIEGYTEIYETDEYSKAMVLRIADGFKESCELNANNAPGFDLSLKDGGVYLIKFKASLEELDVYSINSFELSAPWMVLGGNGKEYYDEELFKKLGGLAK
ncbi:MAG: hypothetical protein V1717_04305, partial [Candidatus Micrarchaeota archaeon]